jgi:hypothetical protein
MVPAISESQSTQTSVVSGKWLEFEGGVISGLFGPKTGVGAPGGDHVWGSVTSFHFSGFDRMLFPGYLSPSG